MQSGSRHWRQLVATRKRSKRSFEVEHEQALRFHQSLRKELINRDALDHFHALLVGEAAFFRDELEATAHCGEALHHVAEIVAGDAHHFHVVEGGAIRRADSTAEQTDFAEIIASREISKDEFAAWIILRNFHETNAHQIKTVRAIALSRDDLSRRKTLQLDGFFQVLDKVRREVREHRHATQVIFERASSIGFVNLRLEGFVFHHDV